MRNPSSMLRGSVRRLRRPSPAMVVAIVALFMATGGASYAAVALPASSVGSTQLKTFAVTNPKLATGAVGTNKIMPAAVTYSKIKPSSVGTVRVVKSEVQLRLQNSCPTGQAMTAVDVNGKVSCASAGGSAETNSAPGSAVGVNSATTAATVSSLALATGSAYLVQSNPYITVTPSSDTSALAQHVVVTCTLTAGSVAAQRSASFDVPGSGSTAVDYASIPLTAALPSLTAAATSTVTCTVADTGTGGGTASSPATVTAQGQIYATQLASATTATTTGTTTTTTPAP